MPIWHCLSSVALKAATRISCKGSEQQSKILTAWKPLHCVPGSCSSYTASGKDWNSIQLNVYNFNCFESAFLQMILQGTGSSRRKKRGLNIALDFFNLCRQAFLITKNTIFPKSIYSFKKEKNSVLDTFFLSPVFPYKWICSSHCIFGCHFSCFETICLHDSDDHPGWFFSSSVHRFGNVQKQLEVICRQWLVTAPEANLPIPSGACWSFTCRWLNGTCLPLPPPSPTHTHTHTHTHTCTAVGFSQLCTVQCSTETHQNTWKWQSEHQEPVSNGIFNHQGFPSKPCLSVFSNC